MNLPDLFDLSLKARATKTALEFAGAEYSFAEIDQRSDRLAQFLLREGFQPGDRLAVYLPNSVMLIDAYLAAAKTGVIFTPVNVLYRLRELQHILADAEPRALLTNTDLLPHLESAAVDGMRVWLAEQLEALVLDASPARPPWRVSPAAPAALVYTSGTTGRSKGALLTHQNFAFNAISLITCWQLTAHDRLLLALPLFHVHGLGNGLHTWLLSGYRLRLLERFRKESILEEFLEFRPTVFFGVPTMYERLLDAPPETAREIGRFMRLFVSGSAPLPARTLERFEKLYGHVILERYGMTETLMNCSNPYAAERRPGSVGKPLPGVSTRLVDPQTENEVQNGERGEILVQGPNVFTGYWRDEGATAAAFTPDGFFRTGDLAVCSPDGYFSLEGRRSELILCGGFNVYPREIEEFLEEQPGVAEAAVTGIADPVRGQRVVAFIVPAAAQPLCAETLAGACRRHLASFKVPGEFHCVERLPRNALGKLQRHLLLKP